MTIFKKIVSKIDLTVNSVNKLTENNEKMKADLHMHGLLSFHPYWLKAQGCEGKNLLKEIADSCFDKGLDFCAITSAVDQVPKEIFYDRLGRLTSYIKALPREYNAGKLGENALIVEKHGKVVYLINGQTVECSEKGKPIEHLVVGSNQVPDFMPLADTLKWGKDNGLIQIAEHPLCEFEGSVGMRLLKKHIGKYDAIEGHNSELIFSPPLSWLPVFKSFSRKSNKKVQKLAENYGKPWVAVSDAHTIKHAGLSHIESDRVISAYNDETIIEGLKETIVSGDFNNICNYEPFLEWVNWVGKFLWATKIKKLK